MSVTLLSNPNSPDGADLTFRTVVEQIQTATTSIEIHMFVWRNDIIGNLVGREILAAAARGISIRIIKDVGAFMYERIEMNRKSFFNKPISKKQKLIYNTIGKSFPDTYCEDDHTDELGQQIIDHPNVTIDWVNHTHTKYYIFDERVMITGSINIEDRHRGYYDYMIQIESDEMIKRFRSRQQLTTPYDPQRPIDFALNVIEGEKKTFEIKPEMIRLMETAKTSIFIEMAYIGDPDISSAITAAAKRGIDVTILFSREANIGNDINYKSMHNLYQSAPITAYLTPKMIHSKLMMIDNNTVIMGSANFSVFSMQKAEELDVIIHSDREFLETLATTIEHRISESEIVTSADTFATYNKRVAGLQQLHQKLNSWFN